MAKRLLSQRSTHENSTTQQYSTLSVGAKPATPLAIYRLKFGTAAKREFEEAVEKLSLALGFKGERPDKKWKQGPGNLWAVNDSEYLLWE